MSEQNPSNQPSPVPELDPVTLPVDQIEAQTTPETSASQEFLDRARHVGRVAMARAGVALSLVREGMAERSVERAVDKHYDTISSEISIGDIRDAAIRTVDKSTPIASRPGSGTELAKGDLVSRAKDWRMDRKLDRHSKASIENKRTRNNTARKEAKGRTFVSKIREKSSARIDFLKGEASAVEMSNRVADAKSSVVYTEEGRVKRAGRAESSEAKKVRKYATKIEKRAEKRVIRAKNKTERKEQTLEKRRETVQKRKQKLQEIESS